MKHYLHIIISLVALTSCFSAQAQGAGAEYYSTRHFKAAIFPLNHQGLPVVGWHDRYTPAFEEVDTAEAGLRRQIKTLCANEAPQISKRLKKYYRQYMAYYNKRGERILAINFFIPGKRSKALWLQQFIETHDGGSRCWQVEYNLESHTFFNFRVNRPG